MNKWVLFPGDVGRQHAGAAAVPRHPAPPAAVRHRQRGQQALRHRPLAHYYTLLGLFSDTRTTARDRLTRP